MGEKSRRAFIKTGVVGGVIGMGSFARGDYLAKLSPTPTEIKGPFYPITPQKDKDFDLTQVEGAAGVATGTVIWIEGTVVDTDGVSIEDASVEIWQANAAGRYSHPHDSNSAALDPNFQGWAIVPSGKNGAFRFKTIKPGSYPAAEDWTRPPHIHFKVGKLGYVELITQMYFPGEPLNEPDLLLKRKSKEEQTQLIAVVDGEKHDVFRFRIVIEKA